jgi:hypothetical protein
MTESDDRMSPTRGSAELESAPVAPGDRLLRQRRPPPTSRLLARAVQTAGALGMAVCLAGLVATPVLKSRAVSAGSRALDAAISQARGGSDMLGLAADSLGSAAAGLRQSASVVAGVRISLQDSAPMLESSANLLEDQAPATIAETRQAIMGAQAGARAIDSFLGALSVLLPFTGLHYDSEDSLAGGLMGAADSLAPLPEDLAGLGGQLREFSGDLELMDQELSALARDMGDLADSLENASKALRRQAISFEDMADGIEASKARVRRLIGGIGWGVGVLSLWLLLSQYGLYTWGGALLRAAEAPGRAEEGRRRIGE